MALIVETGEAGANSIKAHNVRAYTRNVWQAMARQSELIDCVETDLNDTTSGTSWDDNVYSRVQVETITDEFTQQVPKRIPRGTRNASWQMQRLTHMIGIKEKADQLIDPTNYYVRSHGEAMGFHTDKRIISIMFADVLENQDDNPVGATNPEQHSRVIKTFPAANIVAVDDNDWWIGKADGATAPAAGPRGLTVGKLAKVRQLAARRRMKGELFIGASENDLINLISSVPVASVDYNMIRALIDGELSKFMGFHFKRLYPDTQVGVDTAAAECPVWVKSAIRFKRRTLVKARIKERADYNYNMEAYVRWEDSGLRRDDTSVFKILNDQT